MINNNQIQTKQNIQKVKLKLKCTLICDIDKVSCYDILFNGIVIQIQWKKQILLIKSNVVFNEVTDGTQQITCRQYFQRSNMNNYLIPVFVQQHKTVGNIITVIGRYNKFMSNKGLNMFQTKRYQISNDINSYLQQSFLQLKVKQQKHKKYLIPVNIKRSLQVDVRNLILITIYVIFRSDSSLQNIQINSDTIMNKKIFKNHNLNNQISRKIVNNELKYLSKLDLVYQVQNKSNNNYSLSFYNVDKQLILSIENIIPQIMNRLITDKISYSFALLQIHKYFGIFCIEKYFLNQFGLHYLLQPKIRTKQISSYNNTISALK